jgi:hypothetical protein
LFGAVAWIRGEFVAARCHFEAARVGRDAAGHEMDAVWFMPADPITTGHLHLALTRLVHGDLNGAEAALAQAARRADELGFPQRQSNHAYTGFTESWIRIETGQLDRAAALAAGVTAQAERHGLDLPQLWGATLHAIAHALAALGADDPDPTALSAHVATMTTLLDTLRAVELNLYITFYDSVVARLLISAGQRGQARARLDTALALARDTGMCFYDAELLRLRARTQTGPDARQADVSAALELARRQGATLFELRAALDDFELRGEPARAILVNAVNHMPADSGFPELVRARARLLEDPPQI